MERYRGLCNGALIGCSAVPIALGLVNRHSQEYHAPSVFTSHVADI